MRLSIVLALVGIFVSVFGVALEWHYQHQATSSVSTAALQTGNAGDNQVLNWCAPGCSPQDFGPLVESTGAVNSHGIKFQSGVCPSFNVPASVEFDYYDGSHSYYQQIGPQHLSRVCEGSFRL
jgi:hypothetical protein